MTYKPKRAQITPEQEATIAKYVLDFPDMSRTKLAEKIQAEVNWLGKPPEIEVLERKISSYRRVSELPQDKPWTLDSLKQNPLPPEVLPKLFPIWLMKQENPLSPPLTIREARWIAQLSGMTDDIELLRLVAEVCAEWELIGELTNSPQLSSPATMLHIYSHLTRMGPGETKEHHEKILKEKQASGTRREETIEGLRAVYGDEFLKTIKLKPKKEAKNERLSKTKKGK